MKTIIRDSQIDRFLDARMHPEFGPIFRVQLKDGRKFPSKRNLFLDLKHLDDVAKTRLHGLLRPGVLPVFQEDPQKAET